MSAESAVYEALMYACSQDAQLLKPAEQKLAEWEVQPGFHLTLVKLFSDQSIDANVRWMASLYFKNGVLKYWRKNAPNAIAFEEKSEIKKILLLKFNEPVQPIAVQIAVLIGNIARYDCPQEWIELVPTLVEVVQNNDLLVQHRGLLVLLQVVKVLSSKRLQRDRIHFEELTTKLYDFILNLWDVFTQLFYTNIQGQAALEMCAANLEKAIISLRILKKLTIYGVPGPHLSPKCMLFIRVVFQRLKELLDCRLRVKQIDKQQNVSKNLTEQVEKFIIKHMKFLNLFFETHPASFVEFIPAAFNFSFHYVFHEGTNLIFEDNVITFPNFAIQCLNLIKGILSHSLINVDGDKEQIINKAKNEFFTPERLSYIFEKIIMHYFLLTSEEFELWDSDPESYVLDEGGDSWKYNLRSCTEAFYMILFQKYSPMLIVELQKFISKSQSITLTESSNISDLLIKDSIYNATGLAVFNLFDEINFDEWFTQQLLEELKFKTHNFRIIRKRIIWLIGRWTGVRFSKSLRPEVYRACVELLQPSEDLAVRLTASKTLKNIMDDFEFDAEQFLEFLEPVIALLFSLLKESNECDTKMTVLYVMSFIIEKMSMSIKLEVESLIQYLPMLWEESREHDMLRCAIISTLLQIIKALYEIPTPEPIVAFIYQIIKMSTNINEPSHVYLLDEGLELWLIVVQYSKAMNNDLLKLCDNLLPLIEQSSNNLRTCLAITETYSFLCPEVFLPSYGKDIIKTCHYLLSDLRAEGVIVIYRLFLTILRVARKYSIELLRPYLVEVFRKYYEHEGFLQINQIYLQMIARVLILDQVTFSMILTEMGIPDALEKILTTWLNDMPIVGRSHEKKLLALALTSLITVSNDIIFDNFSSIMTNISETLNDITNEDEQSGAKVEFLILADDNEDEIGMIMHGYGFIDTENLQNETPHYDRCRKVCLQDPIHVIVLKDYLQSQLIALKSSIGAERYQTLLSRIDLQILKELSDFVSLGVQFPI
ncbi:importin-11 isoform X1 [Toxorhynchites rutilus septentrionalis]|uniref:importin-11 isoform X1 n=2 Tax=Toxorhynchites rutilus septentrionalis TaxID=329112 RepID=UPI00247839A8|nr:importin-11 isoform X1 [Toxorhynchites rutilus septentrionalis]